jgi:hypothetical protein
MIKNVLTHIGGIGLYGVISICIFFSVFIAVTLWMLFLKKPYLTSMRALPLEEDAAVKTQPDSTHE